MAKTRKIKKLIDKKLKYELWNLLTWVASLDHKVRIQGVCQSNDVSELCLINDHADFMGNFEIDDIETVHKLTCLCCLWANKGISAKEDYDGNSIYDYETVEINSG